MVFVFNNIDKAAGHPNEATVTIELLWNEEDSPVASELVTQTTIVGPFETSTDEDGRWETSLVPNDDIYPDDNVYKVTEEFEDETITYYIYLYDGATPQNWAIDAIVDQPDWVA